jgi:hypothetical protein
MTGFASAVDIVNRALQRIGAKRIGLLTDTSRNAAEASACYDKLRRAELRRNVWVFSIKRAAIRPVGTFNATKFLTFAAWAIGTTYAQNDVVTGSDSQVYYSLGASNLANDPVTTTGYWAPYFGPLTASEYVGTWGAGFTYALGDHAVGSDSKVYVSLIVGNINHNPVSTVGVDWQIATTADTDDLTKATSTSVASGFYAGEIVFIGAAVYLSLQSSNTDAPPSSQWLTLTAAPALAVPDFIYPLGAGPLQQSGTRNVFKLPNNYLRTAPQSTKQGSVTVMGSPTNLSYTDWEYESGYLTSAWSGPIPLRFVADMTDVTQMDDMFCEGLGARMAMELCEPLTQSAAKLQAIEGEYKTFMAEARAVNGIEIGPVEQPLDDLLQVRN